MMMSLALIMVVLDVITQEKEARMTNVILALKKSISISFGSICTKKSKTMS
jgi:hypothetical protein